MARKIDQVIDDIIEQYLEEDNNIPWIIGFSGGKDSTVLLILVWKALIKLRANYNPLNRMVYVVNNDTLVENPIITDYVVDVLGKIKRAAEDQGLPIKVKTTAPKLEDSFWVNFLGKGYPVPNNAFRWCTERLKIRPTSQFILDKVNEIGEAIILIGTRLSESSTRARSIRKHEIKGKRLTKHPLNPNTYTYAPIKELYLEEVWSVINSGVAPWGYDNSRLFQLYANAGADDYECPTVVVDKTQPSCGQSRFGCWVCTVVKEDKSMRALIRNGNEWMKPLLDFRDQLVEERNISDNRCSHRRNGQLAIDENGHNQGNYTAKYRIDTLRRLLITQKEIQRAIPHAELITSQELVAIQVIWYRDSIFETAVTEIYNDVYNRNLPFESMGYNERLLLEDVCLETPNDYELICDLVSLYKSKTLLMNNSGFQNDIENRLNTYIKEN